MNIDRDAIFELAAIVGVTKLTTIQADLTHYGRDWTRSHTPAPSAIVFPESAADVQTIVRWAHAHKVALVPSGGRTGLSGGAVAARGEVVVSMQRMCAILGYDTADRTLTVQAGITTQQVQEAARERGLCYPRGFQQSRVLADRWQHRHQCRRHQGVALRTHA